ncbi:MAG: beta-propeller domain-containing protein [Dehalococcoidia bacterium]|nr:beta-propeller domain-containing protein [Dehalococcoidia bacterium]
MKNRMLSVALCLVLIASALVSLQCSEPASAHEISRFSSYDQLKKFVNANTKDIGGFWLARAEADAGAPAPAPEASGPDYSATNIQVAGVDEADIVKTDGQYIYVVSGARVIIVRAYPPEQAAVLSEIELEGMAMGLFINGDRLVVLEGGLPYYYYDMPVGTDVIGPYMPYTPRTSIKVYDVSDREDPSLEREISVEGNYVSSRMIGDYVYVVVNESVYDQDGEVRLPGIYVDEDEQEIPATDIYYYDAYDYFYQYTTIIALDIQNDDLEPAVETIMLGYSSNLYVSPDNIYLTIPIWGRIMWESQTTAIHRIHIDGLEIEYVASGEVPGMVLNQFSMDQYEGYFRVATTTWGEQSLNHIYTLDMDLNIAGRLEDLAPTERIFSARFMGERAYLVTFEIIDPLFVIDLKDPLNPRVLGELKITGYSDYLHLYDENHLIGIGKETEEAEDGRFSWMQGVKISFFDVSDVSNPQELSTFEIGERGTDSPVSWDHKAFLFDKSRNLMVIPVCVAEIDEADYPDGVPDWAWGKYVWQGAYVFHVSPEEGIRLDGGITHFDAPPDEEQYYYYCYSPFTVQRSLYIGDVLYTVSEAMIRMNDLATLDYINDVELPYSSWEPPYYTPEELWDGERLPEPPGDESEGEEPSDD